ncbi:hypothetical protein BB560_005273 [Smittium megazygosporum]|uniref:Uncharacterized protein n=1 Tax=Smittium megazygosporum TaxID=133381 RepID=A0A2T9Z727_9FUNG|nr:hypothetical protein BB560_005273 [Smittium megazygosporum]
MFFPRLPSKLKGDLIPSIQNNIPLTNKSSNSTVFLALQRRRRLLSRNSTKFGSFRYFNSPNFLSNPSPVLFNAIPCTFSLPTINNYKSSYSTHKHNVPKINNLEPNLWVNQMLFSVSGTQINKILSFLKFSGFLEPQEYEKAHNKYSQIYPLYSTSLPLCNPNLNIHEQYESYNLLLNNKSSNVYSDSDLLLLEITSFTQNVAILKSILDSCKFELPNESLYMLMEFYSHIELFLFVLDNMIKESPLSLNSTHNRSTLRDIFFNNQKFKIEQMFYHPENSFSGKIKASSKIRTSTLHTTNSLNQLSRDDNISDDITDNFLKSINISLNQADYESSADPWEHYLANLNIILPKEALKKPFIQYFTQDKNNSNIESKSSKISSELLKSRTFTKNVYIFKALEMLYSGFSLPTFQSLKEKDKLALLDSIECIVEALSVLGFSEDIEKIVSIYYPHNSFPKSSIYNNDIPEIPLNNPVSLQETIQSMDEKTSSLFLLSLRNSLQFEKEEWAYRNFLDRWKSKLDSISSLNNTQLRKYEVHTARIKEGTITAQHIYTLISRNEIEGAYITAKGATSAALLILPISLYNNVLKSLLESHKFEYALDLLKCLTNTQKEKELATLELEPILLKPCMPNPNKDTFEIVLQNILLYIDNPPVSLLTSENKEPQEKSKAKFKRKMINSIIDIWGQMELFPDIPISGSIKAAIFKQIAIQIDRSIQFGSEVGLPKNSIQHMHFAINVAESVVKHAYQKLEDGSYLNPKFISHLFDRVSYYTIELSKMDQTVSNIAEIASNLVIPFSGTPEDISPVLNANHWNTSVVLFCIKTLCKNSFANKSYITQLCMFYEELILSKVSLTTRILQHVYTSFVNLIYPTLIKDKDEFPVYFGPGFWSMIAISSCNHNKSKNYDFDANLNVLSYSSGSNKPHIVYSQLESPESVIKTFLYVLSFWKKEIVQRDISISTLVDNPFVLAMKRYVNKIFYQFGTNARFNSKTFTLEPWTQEVPYSPTEQTQHMVWNSASADRSIKLYRTCESKDFMRAWKLYNGMVEDKLIISPNALESLFRVIYCYEDANKKYRYFDVDKILSKLIPNMQNSILKSLTNKDISDDFGFKYYALTEALITRVVAKEGKVLESCKRYARLLSLNAQPDFYTVFSILNALHKSENGSRILFEFGNVLFPNRKVIFAEKFENNPSLSNSVLDEIGYKSEKASQKDYDNQLKALYLLEASFSILDNDPRAAVLQNIPSHLINFILELIIETKNKESFLVLLNYVLRFSKSEFLNYFRFDKYAESEFQSIDALSGYTWRLIIQAGFSCDVPLIAASGFENYRKVLKIKRKRLECSQEYENIRPSIKDKLITSNLNSLPFCADPYNALILNISQRPDKVKHAETNINSVWEVLFIMNQDQVSPNIETYLLLLKSIYEDPQKAFKEYSHIISKLNQRDSNLDSSVLNRATLRASIRNLDFLFPSGHEHIRLVDIKNRNQINLLTKDAKLRDTYSLDVNFGIALAESVLCCACTLFRHLNNFILTDRPIYRNNPVNLDAEKFESNLLNHVQGPSLLEYQKPKPLEMTNSKDYLTEIKEVFNIVLNIYQKYGAKNDEYQRRIEQIKEHAERII